MPINLTISGESAREFLDEARGVLAGLTASPPQFKTIGEDPYAVVRHAVFGDGGDRTAETPAGNSIVLPEPAATGPEPAPAEPPKRGRPRKTAEAKPATFTVRRYGGMIEGEYTDSGEAAEVLVGLIQAAADEQALDELMKHNAEDMLLLPRERATEILESVDAVRAVLKSGEPEAAAAPSALERHHGRVHNDLNGNPLTEVDVTAIPGVMAALNAFCAMDDGTPQGPHYQKARAHMDSLGIVTVRKLDPAKPEDMAKLKALGEWCAEGLGLPVAGSLL